MNGAPIPVPSGAEPPLRVPGRALAISLAAFGVPVIASLALPDVANSGVGTLVWLPALIPAFLLAYYRGMRGVAIALAGGMAVITATQLSVVWFDIAEPNWSLLAAIVGAYLAVSVGIAVLAEALRRERRLAEALAFMDRLTALPNRRQLDITLEAACASAERGHPVTVVIFDLDHFKRVNDVHGHAAGDLALQEFAQVLRANTRKQDLSARFGGEEFVSVLRDGDEAAAVKFAERVCQQMRDKKFAWGTQTVSAGVAAHQAGMASHELLLAAADRALYTSKHNGRDRVSTATHVGLIAALVPEGPARPATPAAGTEVPKPSRPPRARLYVVDDEPEIRTTLRLALTEDGYEVWDTDDPKEAIRHFAAAAESERPDAIISDVIMPGMTGMTMVDQIVALCPTLRVIYMSGYVKGPVSWAGAPGAVVRFLEKPFTIDTLMAAVEGILAAERGPAA